MIEISYYRFLEIVKLNNIILQYICKSHPHQICTNYQKTMCNISNIFVNQKSRNPSDEERFDELIVPEDLFLSYICQFHKRQQVVANI